MITEKDFLNKFKHDKKVTEIMDDGSVDGDSILMQVMYCGCVFCNIIIYPKKDRVDYDCYVYDREEDDEIVSVKKTVSPITLESFDDCMVEVEKQIKASGRDLKKIMIELSADVVNDAFDTIGNAYGVRDLLADDKERENLKSVLGEDLLNQLWEVINDYGYYRLKDSDDKDAFDYLNHIMEDCHYDNGEPLCCDDWSYWEHYDRDQDYWSFFDGFDIDHFEMEKGHLVAVLEITLPELVRIIHNNYDDASWEHDFGDRTPDEVRA